MCNLNQINTKNNELIFAHCTLPVNMQKSVRYFWC
jgi:hypothetical protein